MKTILRCTLAALGLLAATNVTRAQGTGPSIILGGGYLEQPENAYGFAQLRWTVYEDAAFAHTFFGELLIHSDDAELDFIGPGGAVLFSEDGDLVFWDGTINYEFEAKIAPPLSFYAGVGGGFEAISIDDRFDDTLDEDFKFIAQVFLGLRAKFESGLSVQLGARHLFRDDFSLLGDQFIVEDTWGFELSVGFRF